MEHNWDNLTRERDALRTDNKRLLEEKQDLQRTLEEAEKTVMVLSDADKVAQAQCKELSAKYTELEKKLAARETSIGALQDQISMLHKDLTDCEIQRDGALAAYKDKDQENCLLAAQLDMVRLIFGGVGNA